MAARVGVKELKNRATQIVRDVGKRHAEYVVTVAGKPVARLVPVEVESALEKRAQRLAALAAIKGVAEQIGAAWPEGVSAVDAVREQRR
jgi:prevent-host-death family protein